MDSKVTIVVTLALLAGCKELSSSNPKTEAPIDYVKLAEQCPAGTGAPVCEAEFRSAGTIDKLAKSNIALCSRTTSQLLQTVAREGCDRFSKSMGKLIDQAPDLKVLPRAVVISDRTEQAAENIEIDFATLSATMFGTSSTDKLDSYLAHTRVHTHYREQLKIRIAETTSNHCEVRNSFGGYYHAGYKTLDQQEIIDELAQLRAKTDQLTLWFNYCRYGYGSTELFFPDPNSNYYSHLNSGVLLRSPPTVEQIRKLSAVYEEAAAFSKRHGVFPSSFVKNFDDYFSGLQKLLELSDALAGKNIRYLALYDSQPTEYDRLTDSLKINVHDSIEAIRSIISQ